MFYDTTQAIWRRVTLLIYFFEDTATAGFHRVGSGWNSFSELLLRLRAL